MTVKTSLAMGIAFAIIAGAAIVMQNTFNNNVSNKVGIWELSVLTHSVGLLVSLLVVFLVGKTGFSGLKEVPMIYWFGGAFGVVIVSCIALSIKSMGLAYTSIVMFSAQLIIGIVLDRLGIMGLDKVPLTPGKIIGVLIVIVGAFVFQL